MNPLRTIRTLALPLLLLPAVAGAQVPERDRYHNAAQMESLLKDLVGKHKGVARLHAYGKSFQKRDLWAVEVTDFSAGKAETKPGILLAGGLQGDEPAASEVALQTLASLLDRYGKDAAVTDLLKTRVLYVIPRANPDGMETAFGKVPYLHKDLAEPLDDDNDDETDEDGPADVNGDGLILQMRIKDPEGEWRTDPADKRLMVRRKPGEQGEWRLFPFEGRDQDGDGLVAEDGLGGTNLNRNFPALWDWRTKQPGAGPFMASAPETIALMEFMLAHTNIGLVEALHVTGAQPFLPASRLGATTAGQDKAILDGVGKKWEEATGNKLPTVAADAADPGAGTFLDWAYLHFGALAVSPELWNAPKAATPDAPKPEAGKTTDAGGQFGFTPVSFVTAQGRGGGGGGQGRRQGGAAGTTPAAPTGGPAASDKPWLDWNDREGVNGFVTWQPFKHPQVGDVEIGGWKPFTRDNPPAKNLAGIAEKETAFFLSFAAMTPLVKMGDVRVDSRGNNVYQVTLSVTNAGATPTANGQGVLNRQTRPVLAILDLPQGAQLLSGVKRLKAGHLAPGETKTVVWTILAPPNTTIKLTADAQRGGTETREVVLR